MITHDTSIIGNHDDEGYKQYVQRMEHRFHIALDVTGGALFTTDLKDKLWDIYLYSKPVDQRQYHNCNACRKFIERYGHLAIIDAGQIFPAFWDSTDVLEDIEVKSVLAIEQAFKDCKITGVFYTEDRLWGEAVTGIWRHFALDFPDKYVYKGLVKNASQASAEKKQDYINIRKAIREFPQSLVNQVRTAFEVIDVFRNEKIMGPLIWLADLHEQIAKNRSLRANIIWKAVALAPPGFCHPRSSVLGSLLDDLSSGLNFDSAIKKFEAKMSPTQYQRPQAAPSEGAIDRAEFLVNQLHIRDSFRRRYARFDEIPTFFWLPKEIPYDPGEGLFASIRKSQQNTLAVTKGESVRLTEFKEDILPKALKLEFHVPSALSSFAALTTAACPDAPPILQWDSLEYRNPFSMYLYVSGSLSTQWGLDPGSWADVRGIITNPAQWTQGFDHFPKGLICLLSGARDSRDAELGLFPETLKSYLHEVRVVIEKYSKTNKLEDRDKSSASGILLSNSKSPFKRPQRFKVYFLNDVIVEYIVS